MTSIKSIDKSKNQRQKKIHAKNFLWGNFQEGEGDFPKGQFSRAILKGTIFLEQPFR